MLHPFFSASFGLQTPNADSVRDYTCVSVWFAYLWTLSMFAVATDKEKLATLPNPVASVTLICCVTTKCIAGCPSMLDQMQLRLGLSDQEIGAQMSQHPMPQLIHKILSCISYFQPFMNVDMTRKRCLWTSWLFGALIRRLDKSMHQLILNQGMECG